jgi:hypothetical protein
LPHFDPHPPTAPLRGLPAAFLFSAILFAAVLPRSAAGQIPGPESVLVAVRTADPISIDGSLDEAVWRDAQPATGFRQRWPADGAPATERTEVRVAYDDQAIYFGMVMFDSEPDRIMRSILHREGRLDQDDVIIIALDTYHDRRSAYLFAVSSFGTQADAHFTNERLVVPNDWMWEGVYDTEARITERGWELEVAIPLTTIRFDEADAATMGVAFYRFIRRKNEEVTWPHIPIRYTGVADGGMDQASQFAALQGLENLRPGRHIEVKPFGILGAQKRAGSPAAAAEADTDVLDEIGVDVKYSLTPSLTLDLTYNTDFAQVEADNVQINLTRFGLFYPEKREFFLERSDLFQFGNSRSTEVFFSRRIGLTNDIIGGGRLHGQAGPVSIAFMNLQTDNAGEGENLIAGANNTVLRLRGDVLPRASVGGILTNFQNSDTYNRTLGFDGEYRFFSSSGIRVWWANTWDEESDAGSSSDGSGSTSAGYASLTLRNDRYSATASYTDVGERFNPALGFVSRRDMVRYGWNLAWTPRFEGSSWARQLIVSPHGHYILGQDGRRQTEDARLDGILNFQAGIWLWSG